MATETSAAPGSESSPPSGSRRETAGGVIAATVLVFLIYLLVKAVDPGNVRLDDDPGFLELVVGNRTVLTVLRVAVLFVAVYAAYSCFELIRGRRPASRFWLVQADEAAQLAQDAGEDAAERIRVLESELDEANQDNDLLIGYVQDLQAQLETRDHDADTER